VNWSFSSWFSSIREKEIWARSALDLDIKYFFQMT